MSSVTQDPPAPSKGGSTSGKSPLKSRAQPIEDTPRSGKLWRGLIVLALIVFTAVMFIFFIDGRPSEVKHAEDISAVYDHTIILQARQGDTLETAALAVFPNTLLETRIREDKLSDDAKALELARYQAEWLRLSRLLTATTGTQLAPGEFFAVPAKSGEPGAIEVSKASSEIQRLTKAYAEASDSPPAGG
ncbi:MAG: hypothetical protein U0526_01655 [Candidatus Saccharibacteria bacterium]|jgi:hypothetical protein